MRFPSLYKDLRDLGADIFLIPSSFARPTGEKHWEVLLRARAIEHGCFVVAAAQSGGHEDGRQTHGHSLVIDPWGDVLLDMGVGAAVQWVDLDKAKISEARERLPTTSLARSWSRSS
jgi:predicted amidohydrolase